MSAAVVAPARIESTSWPARRCGPVSRHAAEHLGLDREQDDVRAFDGFVVARPTRIAVLARQLLAPFGPRMARDDLVGLDELPRSSPAIIASAMTPEPTVAIVRCAQGAIARSIAERLARRPSVRQAEPVREEEAAVV